MQLSKTELAGLLRISPKTLQSYIQMGMTGRVGAGSATKYEASLAIEFHVAHHVDLALKERAKNVNSAGVDMPPIEESESALVYWKAEREKHRTLAELETLVPHEWAVKELATHLGIVRQGLMSFAPRAAPYLVMVPDELTAREMIERKVHELMDALAQQIADVETNDELDEAEGGDNGDE